MRKFKLAVIAIVTVMLAMLIVYGCVCVVDLLFAYPLNFMLGPIFYMIGLFLAIVLEYFIVKYLINKFNL